MSLNSNPFYHFTSLKAFKEITSAGELLLSCCNDIKNIVVKTEALNSALRSIFEENKDLREKLLTLAQVSEVTELIDLLCQERGRTYVACFYRFDETNEIENIRNANNMWVSYADDNNGVVIKFNPNAFPLRERGFTYSIDPYGNQERLGGEIRIVPVIYSQEDLVKGLNVAINSGNIIEHAFITDVYKPESYSEEREERFLVFVDSMEELIHDDRRFLVKQPDQDDGVGYLHYKFASQDYIQKVFCRTEDTKNELCSMLKVDIEVEVI